MKKILVIVAAAAVFAACTNKQKEQELQASRDSIAAIRQAFKMDSLRQANELALQQKAAAEREAAEERRRNTRVAGYSESGYVTPATPAPERKKGMSSAAKGALIGAGAGAITGVLIDKKDGRGAVIGGVVGAGTGYAIGKSKDDKKKNP
jgi:hypothetical protein